MIHLCEDLNKVGAIDGNNYSSSMFNILSESLKKQADNFISTANLNKMSFVQSLKTLLAN